MRFDDPKIQAEYDAMIARRPSSNSAPPSPPPQPVVVPDKLLDRLRANPTAAFEAVLGRLTHKIGQKEPVANCPFHEDRHPSLRVNLDKLACFCDPCGHGWGIVDLAKEVWGCDFKEAARRLAPDDRPKPVPVRTIRYSVRDLEGEVVATHVRKEYADGSKQMPWEPVGTKPSELPLFQIEKTADSGDGEAVIVCEGEKAALKLWEQDRTLAVGTVTGSSHLPCDESLKRLLRLTVYLWPDHDDPGYEHMRRIGEKLLALGHSDVWKIKWSEAPEKGDAADYHGDIGALLDSAERFTSVPALPTNGTVPATIDTVIDRTPIDGWQAGVQMLADQRDYSWAGLIRDGGTMILTALMGAGKTTLALNVARGWALGQEVLGRKCKVSKTLAVVSPKEYEVWAETIKFWEIRETIYLIESHRTHFDSSTDQAAWLETTMNGLGCRTFVLDTLFDFFGLPPNIRGDSNRIAMNEQIPLLDVVLRNGFSGIVTGHAPKSEAQALVPRDPEESFGGHTAWSAQHRMRGVIRRRASGISTFMTGRGMYGDQGLCKERLLTFDEVERTVGLGADFSDYLGETALPSILDALAGGTWMSRSALEKATGKGKNWVLAGLKHGVKAGEVLWNSQKSRSSKYAIKGTMSEAEQQSLGY